MEFCGLWLLKKLVVHQTKVLKTVKHISLIFVIHVILVSLWVIIQDVFLNIRDFDISIQKGLEENFLLYIFFIVLAGPLLEETVFRLPLRRSKYSWLALLFGALLLLGMKIGFIKICIAFFLLFIIYDKWIQKSDSNSRLLITFSILTFGIIHIGNYTEADLVEMTMIEIISTFISQIFLGGVLTYLRLKYSFLSAVIYHSIFNSIVVTLGLMANYFNK